MLFLENIVPGGSQWHVQRHITRACCRLFVHRRSTRALRVETPLTPGKGPTVSSAIADRLHAVPGGGGDGSGGGGGGGGCGC